MRPCSSCRAELAPNARFCAACGAEVESVSQAPTQAAQATVATAPRSSPISSSSSSVSGGLAPGTLLAGRYRIVALLGRGGMGEVYRAEDLRLGQFVALKFLRESLANDPVARERLAAEVRLARQVTHPNVCRVHDLEEADGHVFLTMEFVDGEDLASLLRRIGRLPGAKALEIARQLGAGLAAAHEREVVHRDLKPGNVMLDGRGHVRVTDFGLAVAEGSGAGEVAGTIAYMAPEQLAGKGATVLSDVFAYGLILYELWTGKLPFPGPSLEEIRAGQKDKPLSALEALTIRHGRLKAAAEAGPAPPSSLGAEIGDAEERVLLRCLAADPARRPRSAASVLASLPGGDALAAALAAGETPSPELVAAAGDEGSLSPARAFALFGLLLAGLVALAAVSSRGMLLNLLPSTKSVAALEVRAQELVTGLGLPGETLDEEIGAWIEGSSVDRVFDVDGPSPELYRRASSEGRALRFWYRRSSSWMEPPPMAYLGIHDNPAPRYSGDATIVLDGKGRLLSMRSIPVNTDESPKEPDGSRLLSAAGLDPGSLTPAKPSRFFQGGTSDAHLAWSGKIDGTGIQAEAFFWKGQPVAFRVFPPGEVRVGKPYVPPAAARVASGIFLLIAVVALVFFVALARRNLGLGRGDLRGASRLAVAVLALLVFMKAVDSHHVPTTSTVRGFLTIVLGCCVGIAVMSRFAYLAVEPALRRRYPRLLVSWSRLLAGGVSDALVATDVLLGLVTGVLVTLLRTALAALPSLVDVPGLRPLEGVQLDPLLKTRWLLGEVAGSAAIGLIGAFLVVGTLLVGRFVLRRDEVAYAVPFLFMALLPVGGRNLPLEIGLGVVASTLYLLCLRNAGLLGLVTAFFTFYNLELFPIALGPDRWFFAASLLGVAPVVALGAVAARFAIGRRPLFTAAALDA